MNKKIMIFVTAMVLIFAMVTGATFAYFVSKSSTVTNTFKPSKFGTPKVTETLPNASDNNTYVAIPGTTLKKDPLVTYTVSSGNNTQVSAYLYVAVKASSDWTVSTDGITYTQTIGTVTDALKFTINTTNWKYLGTADGARIYVYVKSNAEQKVSTNITTGLQVIKDNNVTVSSKITKAQMEAETALGTVAFTAHAVQTNGFSTASAAWDAVNTKLATT
jgi:hypothetical protein